MKQVNIHDAKTQLSKLVERAAQGEAFIIAKAGKPMVKVLPLGVDDLRPSPRVDFLKGATIPADFDRMGEDDIAEMFGGP